MEGSREISGALKGVCVATPLCGSCLKVAVNGRIVVGQLASLDCLGLLAVEGISTKIPSFGSCTRLSPLGLLVFLKTLATVS